MPYFLRYRAGLYIILMLAALKMTLGVSGAAAISQAKAEEVVLGGPSCNVVSSQGQGKKCRISDDQAKQAIVVTGLFPARWTLAQLEQFRILNENFRSRLEKDREISEQQRISSGVLFTPGYLRDIESYKKGMKLYYIRAKSYQKRVVKLNQNSLKSLAITKRKRTRKKHKPRRRLVRQETDKEFPYFPGAE